ncbi:spheroidene monooxygenase [Roseovarius nanhaiticus]|uniref:spheroidene monooxygenase n=1 Tax=Roseovarius nanhaiticus TaxID=573024 RepID=UPI0024927E9D|nr:spheroidene monooxygenase [Roseovarius nanhaiticus]
MDTPDTGQIVTLTFHRFDGLRARLWAFAMMGLARPAMARVPGIGFWKLCGSGTGIGFTPRPNLGVYAILATWPDADTARAALTGGGILGRYRSMASESWTVLLRPLSARGAWSGKAPFQPQADAGEGTALAALTRATIRPSVLARFWGRVPDISGVIGSNTSTMFKIGIGEVPWLHQVTFSIWPDTASMAAFARTGPHAEAIRAVRAENWFSEELYARFAIHSDMGSWNGVSPLAPNPSRLASEPL